MLNYDLTCRVICAGVDVRKPGLWNIFDATKKQEKKTYHAPAIQLKAAFKKKYTTIKLNSVHDHGILYTYFFGSLVN